MNIKLIIIIGVTLCTLVTLAKTIYKKYQQEKKYYIPFGNKKFHYLMSFDELFDLEVPYRQVYNIKKKRIDAYYKTEIDYAYSIIKYIFLDDFLDHKVLKAVEIEMECDNFIDAKNALVDVKQMLLDFYGTKLTYNDFEEDKKKRTFHNSFGIKVIDFDMDIQNNMLYLSMKIK